MTNLLGGFIIGVVFTLGTLLLAGIWMDFRDNKEYLDGLEEQTRRMNCYESTD